MVDFLKASFAAPPSKRWSLPPHLFSLCSHCDLLWVTGCRGNNMGFLNHSLKRPSASAVTFFGIHLNYGKKFRIIKDYIERLRCHSSYPGKAPWWVTKDIWNQPDCHQPTLDWWTLTLDFSFLVALTSTWNVFESYHLPRSSGREPGTVQCLSNLSTDTPEGQRRVTINQGMTEPRRSHLKQRAVRNFVLEFIRILHAIL